MSTFEKEMKARKLTFTWLADELDLNKTSTWRWARFGVPSGRVLEVEKLTGISRHVIRPDLYPEDRPFRPKRHRKETAQTAALPMASKEVSVAE